MGHGSVLDPQSRFRIDQRLGNQLAAGICRLRSGTTPPPAVRDLHVVDDSGYCPLCQVTYIFGSVDTCLEDERRVPPKTDKHGEHRGIDSVAKAPYIDDPNERATDEEHKSRLQAVNEIKACREAGEAPTKDTKHNDPNMILPHTETQPNTACAAAG
ncbi:hypothetical protein N7G274_009285 [Stereocaulon virgatum]|uniref:Uncharacterized protein n=1 Tax=Stereocaulon virgatum TaxID=373712 RepID=A0ABR3ZXZ6_9LECA